MPECPQHGQRRPEWYETFEHIAGRIGHQVKNHREAEPGPDFEYLLLATSRTSTMQKEIREAADQGFQVVGMTVGETQFGGSELVTITRRSRP